MGIFISCILSPAAHGYEHIEPHLMCVTYTTHSGNPSNRTKLQNGHAGLAWHISGEGIALLHASNMHHISIYWRFSNLRFNNPGRRPPEAWNTAQLDFWNDAPVEQPKKSIPMSITPLCTSTR